MGLTKKVLVVEDDLSLARLLMDNLAFCGFEAAHTADGNEVVNAIRTFSPDIVLLDLVIPGVSGFDLCGLIRQGGRLPVIMLTARSQKEDKIRGLQAGADDYVTKPFDFDELRARIWAVLRRARAVVAQLKLGDTLIDFRARRAVGRRGEIHLTHREFDVLLYLAERQGFPVLRGELLREVWGYPDEPSTRAVDFTIRRLRKKLEPDPHHPRYIHTVHGDGYSLNLAEG